MEPLVLPSAQALAQEAAHWVAARAREAVEKRGRFCWALAGGSTPLAAYELLGQDRAMPWADCHLFWGDERCVPRFHPQSNFGAALKALGPPAGLPTENLHPMPASLGPIRGAQLYEQELRAFFGSRQLPVLDLVLLGLGADGHVASLFAGDPAGAERQRWTAPAHPPPGVEPALPRVTLTLPVLNAALAVMVLVAGRRKAQAAARVLEGQGQDLPAGWLCPDGGVHWLLDQEAAGHLDSYGEIKPLS